ncbi:MAG: arginyl-tRNA synthetase [Candidatus Angelobacter sp.]|nr:arginyl-tRNA synthetase [Candidatus Angelobacter sp.]
MYLALQQQLIQSVRDLLKRQYDVELLRIVVDQPPSVGLGEYALPLSFELAKKLRKPPRKIAEEVVAGLGHVPGFEKFEVAGAGYINARLNREETARLLLSSEATQLGPVSGKKILVEHTSINPNKAAHIGHLRNAILGDTFVRLLQAAGARVDVQNYIDNTGVQVADVVVGLMELKKLTTLEEVKKFFEKMRMSFTWQDSPARTPADALLDLDTNEDEVKTEDLPPDPLPIDYYLWNLYARVSGWYEQPGKEAERKQIRLAMLHAIEQGGNEQARIARFVSDSTIQRHLETMERLGIEYDFLPQESEILHLHFWDLAFEQMKQKGVLYFETEGKNKGCWVMKRASSSQTAKRQLAAEGNDAPEAKEGPDEDAKVIVRSNNTVTYVGKDIAYHLWKFGLLGRDFGYQRFYRYPNGRQVWISAETGEADHPHFGGVNAIYNVIDSRQADPQNNVIEAIRGLGYTKQAEDYHHFSYEMVALTPRCAMDLGYEVSEEDQKRSYIEVSGRKGFGVKADDLLDSLIAAAQKEVDSRHAEMSEQERQETASQIAIGALRYFMLKFTKNSVIAFDLKEALSFEGETGPYVQYAIVRATNIFRKAALSADEILAGQTNLRFLKEDDELWELWLRAGQLSSMIEQCISTTEPAYAAKFAFQLAQQFNNFYHKHHILTEPDEERKRFLLATAAVVRRALIETLGLMGIGAPDVM